jgi:hypothetical protein
VAGKTLTNQQQILQQRHLIGHQAIQQQQQQLRMQKLNITVGFLVGFIFFNATFNNISVIS